MRIYIFLFLLIFSYSCSTENSIQYDKIDISIQIEKSFLYDLKNETYTVYFMDKAPYNVKFSLSDYEKNEIAKLYTKFNLDEINSDLMIEDKCKQMPKIYTTLTINTKLANSKIKFDPDCSNLQSSSRRLGKNVNKFCDYILMTINAKPEIKSAPISDILYF